MLLMVLAVIVMACFNAMVVPLALEKQILLHPRSQLISSAARECGQQAECWAGKDLTGFLGPHQDNHTSRCLSSGPILQK